MSERPSNAEIALLHRAYSAFNARDIPAAVATMDRAVEWPRAFKGGHVQGRDEVAAYWSAQWAEIDPHVDPVAFCLEPAGTILVDVHQVVRDLTGGLLMDVHVGHRYALLHGLIRRMDVCELPTAG